MKLLRLLGLKKPKEQGKQKKKSKSKGEKAAKEKKDGKGKKQTGEKRKPSKDTKMQEGTSSGNAQRPIKESKPKAAKTEPGPIVVTPPVDVNANTVAITVSKTVAPTDPVTQGPGAPVSETDARGMASRETGTQEPYAPTSGEGGTPAVLLSDVEPNTEVSFDSRPTVGEGWNGEVTARIWLEKCGVEKTRAEFEGLPATAVDVERECGRWMAHPRLNQSPDHPVLDRNIFKPPDANDYVNISLLEVPLRRNIYIGQIPTVGSEETFWKAVFELRIMSIHILHEDMVTFFPPHNGDFMHYNTMFVNNRRAETVNNDVLRFTIEVLPAGFSNSIFTAVTLIKNWGQDSAHPRPGVVVNEVNEFNAFLSTIPADENVLVMSKNGAGRAGSFAAIVVASNQLSEKTEPAVVDVVRSIRAQRPKAVETLALYAFVYIAMFEFIRRKIAKSDSSEKKESSNPWIRKTSQLATTFTTSLATDTTAGTAAGKSTLTGVPK